MAVGIRCVDCTKPSYEQNVGTSFAELSGRSFGIVRLQTKSQGVCFVGFDVALSTTEPTSLDLRSKPGLRGGKPATNCLYHGTARHNLLAYFSPFFFFFRMGLVCWDSSCEIPKEGE
jgi:hypothetical protein